MIQLTITESTFESESLGFETDGQYELYQAPEGMYTTINGNDIELEAIIDTGAVIVIETL